MALNVKITFDLDTDKLRVEDLTDYSSGYTGNIHGTVYILGPAGVIHPGGTATVPDLTQLSSQYVPTTPLQASRKFEITSPTVLAGVYQVIYTVYDNAGSGTAQAITHDFTYAYSSPAPSLAMSFNLGASLVTSTDSTDYTLAGAQTLDPATPIDRTHNIIAPPGAVDALGTAIPNPANSGSSASITYTGITTGTWTSTLSTLVTTIFGTGTSTYYVSETITDGAAIGIVSDLGLCNVYCCLKALNMRYEEAKCKNKELAEDYKVKIEEVTRLLTLMGQALDCGLTGDASQYLLDIKRISECGTECDCYDSENVPALIPITSSSSTTAFRVESASSRLNVSSSGSGTSADPVIYSVDLGSSISGDISYIAGGIQSMASRIRTLQDAINSTSSTLSSTASSPEIHYFTISNDYGAKTSVYSEIFLSGDRFNNGSIFNLSMPTSSSTGWLNNNNLTSVSNLYPSNNWAGVPYMISGVIQNNSAGLILDIHTNSYQTTGSFSFSIKDSEGMVLTNNFLTLNHNEIVIDFTLISNTLV
tara:strand:+ start:581 stop:2182 length:1602 start_codon:yes stop_codon:yes gene_type:complete